MIEVPELSLVVLVGVSGSGKSTFAAARFAPFEAVSSDFCRGLVSNDPNSQEATADAFELLHHIVGMRLRAGLLTVVDATNVQPHARKSLVELARAHDVLPVAVVLDVPVEVAAARNAARPDRDFGADVVKRQHQQLRRSVRDLRNEGFRAVHHLQGVEAVAAAQVARVPLRCDRRDQVGPFDVVGDVHGCLDELVGLLGALGYTVARDGQGRAVDAAHPGGRRAAFVGDLVDRGPDSPGVLRLVMGMVGAGHALLVPGNHDDRLVRALKGRDVKRTHGLAQTLEQLDREPPGFAEQVRDFLDPLVTHLVLDGGRLVLAHAGLKQQYQGRASARVRDFALYGQSTGETDEYGLPVRYPWASEYRGSAMVLYGHTPVPEPEWVNNTLCLDTGCVFGGALTALRYPEKEVVSVPARRQYYAPARPLAGAAPAAPAAGAPEPTEAAPGGGRADHGLELDDVLGATGVQTTLHGRVTIRPENAAGALEVMSRFAVDPRWLVYLPPTMAPCPTSADGDLLEAPAQAFAFYRKAGVRAVVCEEKHMGSRAVLLLCRDAGVAARRFAVPDGRAGIAYTRTGRQFFDDGRTGALVDAARAAVGAAGLWEELASDWLLLDAELLPWSAKAADLLRGQYAPVGAAARADLAGTAAVLEQAAGRGLPVGDLLERTRRRQANADRFTAAYAGYVWPVGGGTDLSGLQLAPFQVLAGEGVNRAAAHDHLWHLGVADRLAQASPLFRPTRHVTVDLGSADQADQAGQWWGQLTAAGGEGMVVKPLAFADDAPRRKTQPGLKVRGRDYLRLIYGPDYTEPEHLSRLRQRNLTGKQSLAMREHALGMEALDRLARGEPLWRVHQAVFGVLALESEPVDPRL